MYQDRLWTMRQYAGFSSVTESNIKSVDDSGLPGTEFLKAFTE
mgnify:CR=1 FL=1